MWNKEKRLDLLAVLLTTRSYLDDRVLKRRTEEGTDK